MRAWEIATGKIVVNNEEAMILEMIKQNNNKYPREKLSERQLEVVRRLFAKEILLREKIDDKYYYYINNVEEISRY
jgi:hypothetical protein